MGCATVASAIFNLRKARTLKRTREKTARLQKQARDWPSTEGFVLYTLQGGAEEALATTVNYRYRVDGEEFDGSESFTFANRQDVERFESGCRGRKVRVRYQQDKPEICVLEIESLL